MARQLSHLVHKPSVRTLRSSGGTGFSMDFFWRLNQAMRLIVYPALGENAFRVGMFDFAHLGYEIGEFRNFRMSVASGANHVQAFGAASQLRRNLFRIEHFVADHVVDFV